MLREIKPKNARSAKALAKKAPLPTENPKTTLFLRSSSCSSLINTLLTDLHTLKRPNSIRFTKKNEKIHPFEDPSSLEFFSHKNDASLLCFGSHTKKRPHALTFVRFFDGSVLDMLEVLVRESSARVISQFAGAKAKVGSKPILSFSGPGFEEESGKFFLAKSLLLDFFRPGAGAEGEAKRQVDIEGLQWMINFTAVEDEVEQGGERVQWVYMRCWRIVTKRSGSKLPRVEIEEMGPRMDMRLGRSRDAEGSMAKEAMKKAKSTHAKPKKNIETDIVGDKMGRIHLGRQELADLQTRKMKGLKRSREVAEEEDEGASALDDIRMSSEGEEVDDGESDAGVEIKRPRLA